jgi:dUTP pyrophosphatase
MTKEAIIIRISQEKSCQDIPLPEYMTSGASGMDIYAAVNEDTTIPAGQIALIPTGLRVSIPVGYEAQIRPRSGLALKKKIGLLNSPGTIDADYRGEIGIIMFNFGQDDFVIKRGDRIAQMIICPVIKCSWEKVENLDDTTRGSGGFGHTKY